MAKDQSVKTPTMQRPKGASSIASSASPVAERKPRTSLAQFVNEVRAEARKITWTSWKETWITSVMVLIMVVVVSVFLRLVDTGLGAIIQQVLKLAG